MTFQSIGEIASKIVGDLREERVWDGSTITEPGVYCGISLDDYHGKLDLFDGPSVSKSALRYMLPSGGSPKRFWGYWKHNPKRVEPKTTDALDFGRATHALLLGDEVFSEKFTVRPDHRPDDMALPEKERRKWNANANDCKDWLKDAHDHGLTVMTTDQMARIRRIAEDAAKHPLVRMGILNGRVERTLAVKDAETGIWFTARPDAMPRDGEFADLKTASSLDEDFLERQISDAGYYLQAGMTKMACEALGLPFTGFTAVYVLNDDVPDTAVVEISEHEIARGERAIRWCLRQIRHGLDTGEWPGARPFDDGGRQIQMKQWAKERLDTFLDKAEALEAAE